MYNQMGEVVGKIQPLCPGFGRNGFPRHDNIAERRPAPAGNHGRGREGQDIGGLVLAAILPVQRADAGVVGEDQGDLGILGNCREIGLQAGGERTFGEGLEFGFVRPAIGLEQDIDNYGWTVGVPRQGQGPSAGVRPGLSYASTMRATSG